MKLTTAQLTVYFNHGVSDCRGGIPFSRRLNVPAGKARSFWEAGWIKADQQRNAEWDKGAAARAEAANADRAERDELVGQSLVNAFNAGKKLESTDLTRIALNAYIGISTKF